MAKPRTLVAIRTHKADAASFAMYDLLRTLPDTDIILCVDERAGESDMAGREKIAFNARSLQDLGLYAHPNAGWLCGDYCHIVVRSNRPHYDHYWLIEPDVLIHTASLAGFFAQFDGVAADLLASGVRAANADWFWTKTIIPLGIAPHRCFYPLTRLSARAIDHLASVRRRISADPAIAAPAAWPNDEALTASALFDAGFSCVDFNVGGRRCYTPRSFRFADFIDRDVITATPPDELLYHPARDFRSWFAGATATVAKLARSASTNAAVLRNHAVTLERIARTCAGKPGCEGASLVPLLLATDIQARVGADIAAPGRNVAASQLAQHFGAGPDDALPDHAIPGDARPGQAAIATAHVVRNHGAPDALQVPNGAGYRLRTIPASAALPYDFDLAAKQMLLTLHMDVALILASPDAGQAQRRAALATASVNFDDLPAIFGPPAVRTQPMLIFPMAGIHSTGLERLVRQFAGEFVNTPHAVSQLAIRHATLRVLGSAERSRLIRFAIVPFVAASSRVCSMQFHPNTWCIAPDIVEAMPDANYAVLVSNRRDWARGVFRSGQTTADAAVALLLEQFAGLAALRRACPGLVLVSTGQIAADPATALFRMYGITLRCDPATPAESQEDMSASDAETTWLQRFDRVWAESPPKSLPQELAHAFGR